MIVTCVKTRLVHAAVRHLLPQSPHWPAVADEEIPISQRDIMVTWHSLPTSVMRKMTAWEVPIPAAESEAFLHSWQVAAHMLGVKDEYIPATWAEANAQAAQILDPVLAPTPEGIKLADILLDLGAADRRRHPQPAHPRRVHALPARRPDRRLAGASRGSRSGTRCCDVAWRPFIAVREGLLPFPLAPAAYWLFDEFLRKAALLFLSEAQADQHRDPGHQPSVLTGPGARRDDPRSRLADHGGDEQAQSVALGRCPGSARRAGDRRSGAGAVR